MFRRQAMKPQTPQRPVEAVTQAIRDGARSRAEIRRTTGLSDSTVDAIIHHLQRTGRLSLEALGGSCSGGGCNSCVAAKANGGCATGAGGGGPVALVLTTRRPE